MFDKGKIYGYSDDEVFHSCGLCVRDYVPKGFVTPTEKMSVDELHEIFPNQAIYLVDVDKKQTSKYTEKTVAGRVLYYNLCRQQVENIYNQRGCREDEDYMIWYSSYEPRVDFNDKFLRFKESDCVVS